MRNKKKSAFTMVELMIVVMIIGILMSIAIPNFMQARETSRNTACSSNLWQIAAAKEQWAMEQKKGATDTPTQADLIGPGSFLRKWPECPSDGTYTINNMATDPTCSVGGKHSLN
jgi:prepilin-type N-terminal cleavage/methylation domain-containing protein